MSGHDRRQQRQFLPQDSGTILPEVISDFRRRGSCSLLPRLAFSTCYFDSWAAAIRTSEVASEHQAVERRIFNTMVNTSA